LLAGRGGKDPLVLEAKEAQASVLEPYLGASEFENHGERVVRGQRMDQAVSDVFLSAPAGGRWQGRTPVQATVSRSPPIWALGRSSTKRLPASRPATPIRTISITSDSRTPSLPMRSARSAAS